MQFELTDDHQVLVETVRGVIANECSPAFVRSVIDDGVSPDGWWKTITELGWPALAVEEPHGGLGLGWVELGRVLEELGYAADPSPFLATTSHFAPVVRHCGDATQTARWMSSVASGELVGALAIGSVTATPTADGWRLDGSAPAVVDADRADEIAVVADTPTGVGVFVVSTVEAGEALRVAPIPAFDYTLHAADLTLLGLDVGDDRRLAGGDVERGIDRALEEATLGWACSMVGASQRVFELTVDYVKQRQQFGVAIGSFQAVKHKAVDMYVAVERARAVVQHATLVVADDEPRRSFAVALAKAAAGECQDVVFRHGFQLFGGIGHTWENDLQIYARRAKVGALMFGRTAEHRGESARMALADPKIASVSLHLPSEIAAAADEFDAWLDANLPTEAEALPRSTSSADSPSWARDFQRRMFDAGWLLPAQPPEFGGRHATLLEQFAIAERLSARRVYHSFNPQGLGIIGPSLLMFGTPEQKARFAVPLLRGELTAALGMSEPNAGSDLGGLRTRAVRDGDEYVINGQKVWTSGAHHADFILTFVRTDPDAPKHKGISCLVVPTDAPGVTCRPFAGIAGPHEVDFNEVFFDDARVSAENLIGPLNGGWAVANGALGEERAMLWLSQHEAMENVIDQFAALADDTPLADDPVTHDWYGTLLIDATALRVLGFRAVAAAAGGRDTAAQSILKLLGSEATQAALNHALESFGPRSLDRNTRTGPFIPWYNDEFGASWFERYVRSFGYTIAGGTSEIQRNIIGERVLGLPR